MNHLLTASCRYFFLAALFTCFIYSNKAFSQSCNNWLNTPSQPSWVNIGDVDVPGTQLTVEALINIKGIPPGGVIQGLDVVSKHTGPANVNYLLRSAHAELSTTNGYFYTPDGCDLEMNKTYHVAMVYNGVSLKYYRNGFLLGETPATGNMIQSDLPTGIGFISTLLQAENFIGFINEVRIWNVARTQAQIRANMNISLVNPPAQTGLVAYYTFDNLLNKQGNPAWNGTIVGAATINQTNPNCVFTADSCAVPSPCDQSLSIPTQGSKVTIGDVDVTGNQLTVEAMFNRSAPLNNGIYYGHLVSKHTDQTNVNYALLPNGCEITTSVSGYKAIFQTCVPELGKTYHVAMVYDGATLKFYRNGFLMNQVACTGNIINNNLLTTIGQIARGDDPFDNQFLGYTNEVRIWSVARTQSQIATYMNTSLPNPATQAGLRAYYSFNNLANKQGNAAFNGTIHGSAAVGKINPDCAFVPSSCNTVPDVVASFTAPDTVCVNTPVNISNISLNATSQYWNFCVADANKIPTAVNLGNPAGSLSLPVFSDIVNDNGNYYVFVSNNWPGGLVRLDFGNSLLNAPVVVNLGNIGGIIPNTIEGIQVVKNEGRWYAIMVGGDFVTGGIPSRVIKIDFGVNITNAAPVGTNWGNIGNLAYPVDLHLFQENGGWYGFTVNAQNNTITRFNFSNSFNNVPTGVNLGNLGGLNYPTGINAVKDNGNWYVFITNDVVNSFLVRLNFGNSLLNVPTAVNLGNPGNVLHKTRDIYVMKACDKITALAVNGDGYNDLVKLDFNNNIISTPTGVSLGNTGNMNFPHSISRVFRAGNDLYCFVTNVNNNSITRIRFVGCNNSSIPNSTLQTPPAIMYSAPGIYNINLTVDEGLSTQSSVCKQVVVLPELVHKPKQSFSICDGGSVKIGSSSVIGTYQWSSGETTDSIVANTTGIYWVETDRFGCVNRDSFDVTISLPVNVELGNDKIICVADNVVLDAGNPGSSYLWNNGSTKQTLTVNTSGQYYVRVTRNGCIASDTVRVTTYNVSSFDFNYKQNVCDPLSVQFSGIGATLTNFYWDFGDGNTLTNTANPVHQFPSAGNYIVRYSIGNGTCSDTIRKTISINTTWGNLILTPDTTICNTNTKQLRTVPSLSFCWSPATYLDNPNSPNPITSTPQDITYYFTAEVAGTNLITNGDFSSGNSGFTSQYNFVNPNTTEAQYFVGANPASWNTSLSTCKDHSSGNGNMLLVNGAPVANVTVWKQTVNVVPNTNYAFSTWIQSLFTPNPAQLQFSINGKDIGPLITASLPTCTWTQFYTTWNSGDSTKAVISIVNKNTQVQGNDFALDDISFAPVFIRRDSVKIKVEKPLVKTNSDTTICIGMPVQLNATGAQSYIWSPATGLSSTGTANPVASPEISTQYIVTGTTINGCLAKDTVNINIFAKPTIVLSGNTTICKNAQAQLSATGGISYSWSPATTLNNYLIANPIASPISTTKYHVIITDANTCEYLDSLEVSIRPDAVFSINNVAPICRFDSAQLSASGGDIYTWQPAEALNNAGISNPVASPSATTDYTVKIVETTCNQSATLTTRLTIMPQPNVTATRSNDIDCSNDRSQLNATGANLYIWTPVTTLNNPAISNPIATPTTTTEYIVTGTNISGCKGYDTVTVKVDNVNRSGYLMPSAFTPNNDGLNDCYGIKYWGVINELEFSIYNRWGERIFFTRNIGQCWDGTYKGAKQNGGVYVYMIRAKTTCESEVFRKGTVVLVR
jgi:gliding motility-associated-like protein